MKTRKVSRRKSFCRKLTVTLCGMAETGLVGVVADSTLTEVLVLGALSMLGGAEARPEGVTD